MLFKTCYKREKTIQILKQAKENFMTVIINLIKRFTNKSKQKILFCLNSLRKKLVLTL